MKNIEIQKLGTFILNNEKQTIYITTLSILKEWKVILCGDNHGSMHIFTIFGETRNNDIQPVFTLESVHQNNNSVTDILIIPINDFYCDIYSVGRDGHLYHLILLKTNDLSQWNYKLINISNQKLDCEVLNKIFLKDKELLILGFFGSELILQNINTKQKVN